VYHGLPSYLLRYHLANTGGRWRAGHLVKSSRQTVIAPPKFNVHFQRLGVGKHGHAQAISAPAQRKLLSRSTAKLSVVIITVAASSWGIGSERGNPRRTDPHSVSFLFRSVQISPKTRMEEFNVQTSSPRSIRLDNPAPKVSRPPHPKTHTQCYAARLPPTVPKRNSDFPLTRSQLTDPTTASD